LDKEINKFMHFQKAFNAKWKLFLIIAVVVLIVFLLSAIISNINAIDTKRILRNITEENNSNKTTLDTLQQTILLLANDTNAVRTQLGFSHRIYPVTEQNIKNNEAISDDVLFFRALEKIYENNNKEKNSLILKEFKTNTDFVQLLNEKELTVIDKDVLQFTVIKKTNLFFQITINPTSSQIQIEDFLKNTIEVSSFDNRAIAFIRKSINTLENHYLKFAQKIDELEAKINEPEIANLIKVKKISISTISEDYETAQLHMSYNNESILACGINKRDLAFTFNNQKIKDITELIPKTIKAINAIELKSQIEDVIQTAHQKLLTIFKDKAFISLLTENNLTILQQPRQEYYFTFYDLLDKTKTKIGSFAVDNYTGTIYITDKDEVQISSINALDNLENQDQKKKIEFPEIIPEIKTNFKNSDGLTFLICGSNEYKQNQLPYSDYQGIYIIMDAG